MLELQGRQAGRNCVNFRQRRRLWMKAVKAVDDVGDEEQQFRQIPPFPACCAWTRSMMSGLVRSNQRCACVHAWLALRGKKHHSKVRGRIAKRGAETLGMQRQNQIKAKEERPKCREYGRSVPDGAGLDVLSEGQQSHIIHTVMSSRNKEKQKYIENRSMKAAGTERQQKQ